MIDTTVSLEQLNKTSQNTFVGWINIEFDKIEEGLLRGRMPVDHRTCQPFGILHGGASASLAETVGSTAAYLSIDREHFFCVGQELKINHLKPVRKGYVYATATPIHIGFQSQVWQIKVENEENELVSFVTLTMAVLPMDKDTKLVASELLRKAGM